MALNETAATKNQATNTVRGLEADYGHVAVDHGFEVDILSQFKANLQKVEELNLRLRFVLNEVNHLVKRT